MGVAYIVETDSRLWAPSLYYLREPLTHRMASPASSTPSGKPNPKTALPLSAREPRPVLRRVGGPLVAYHAMILLGAFLLVTGSRWGFWSIVGAVLVAAGILVELGILIWSASLTRTASVPHHLAGTTSTKTSRASPRRVCPACGRVGDQAAATCPRCGRAVVSLGRAQ